MRAQSFTATFYNADSSPYADSKVLFNFVVTGSPPLYYTQDGSNDPITYNTVTETTNGSGVVTFSLFCPPDTSQPAGYYTVTVGETVYQTTSFSYTSGTINLASVLVAPGSTPTTVTMTADAFDVDAVGDGTFYLIIGLEVDGIVDETSYPVSATDQVTYPANSFGQITANLIPTSAYRGSVKPKYKATLPSGQTILFSAPDGGGNIFASISVASGTSLVSGPPGLVWLGPWSNSTAYVLTDAVEYDGSSYICILANTNQEPDTSPTYWQYLAEGSSPSVNAASKIFAAANFV